MQQPPERNIFLRYKIFMASYFARKHCLPWSTTKQSRPARICLCKSNYVPHRSDTATRGAALGRAPWPVSVCVPCRKVASGRGMKELTAEQHLGSRVPSPGPHSWQSGITSRWLQCSAWQQGGVEHPPQQHFSPLLSTGLGHGFAEAAAGEAAALAGCLAVLHPEIWGWHHQPKMLLSPREPLPTEKLSPTAGLSTARPSPAKGSSAFPWRLRSPQPWPNATHTHGCGGDRAPPAPRSEGPAVLAHSSRHPHAAGETQVTASTTPREAFPKSPGRNPVPANAPASALPKDAAEQEPIHCVL